MIKQRSARITYASYCMTLDLVEAHLSGKESAGLFGDIGAAILPYIKQLAEEFKLGFKDIVEALKNKDIFKLLKSVHFNLTTLVKAILAAGKFIDTTLKVICKKIAASGFIGKLRKGLVKIEDLFKEYPVLKKITGPLLAGIMIYMWIQMSFVGDFESDFDMSDIVAAFHGGYSIVDLLTTANGLQNIVQFVIGIATGLSFVWLVANNGFNLLVGILYTLYKNTGKPAFAKQFFSKIKHHSSVQLAIDYKVRLKHLNARRHGCAHIRCEIRDGKKVCLECGDYWQSTGNPGAKE